MLPHSGIVGPCSVYFHPVNLYQCHSRFSFSIVTYLFTYVFLPSKTIAYPHIHCFLSRFSCCFLVSLGWSAIERMQQHHSIADQPSDTKKQRSELSTHVCIYWPLGVHQDRQDLWGNPPKYCMKCSFQVMICSFKVLL